MQARRKQNRFRQSATRNGKSLKNEKESESTQRRRLRTYITTDEIRLHPYSRKDAAGTKGKGMSNRYTEGICGNAAAILDYGQPITISDILKRLNKLENIRETCTRNSEIVSILEDCEHIDDAIMYFNERKDKE